MSDLKERIVDALRGERMIDFVAEDLGPMRRQGRDYVVLCPFHDDHRPSLGINVHKSPQGIFKCPSCGWGGDVFKFVQDYHRLADFKDVLKHMAERLNLPCDVRGSGKRTDRVRREKAKPAVPAVTEMAAREVLDAYRFYQSVAVEPSEWVQKLGADPADLDLIGGVVAPLHIWPGRIDTKRMTLVVPMRQPDGALCSLRFRMFDDGRRFSLDAKERPAGGGRPAQVRYARAGLMGVPGHFDPATPREGTFQIAVEGETDLLAGVRISRLEWGDDPTTWRARWFALPGVNTCHDLFLDVPASRVVLLLFDDDAAGHSAIFDHRPRKLDPHATERRMVVDLEKPLQPGLLRRAGGVGREARAVFPPPHPDQEDRKYDLRDMVADGWGWQALLDHCLRHGTADPTGHAHRRRHARATRNRGARRDDIPI